MSALATIFGSLGELSESELRQLYLAIGVRLGSPDAQAVGNPQLKGGGKTSSAKQTTGKSGKSGTTSKGNPQRKSQWANHPLYQEYSRLKKVVEAQAKESKLSFNSVSTAESRAYKQAFTQWVEAKHSFRGHGEGDEDEASTKGKAPEKAPEKKDDIDAKRNTVFPGGQLSAALAETSKVASPPLTKSSPKKAAK